MKFDFIVFGATGMQGRVCARDLLEHGHSALLCGRDKTRVERLLKRYRKSAFAYIDLSNEKATMRLIKKSGANVVLNCAEGDWNINVLHASLKAGAHCLDLGSEIPMTKEQLALHETLKKRGLLHITGCGSVPGIGNVMLRYAVEKFDTLDEIEVGFAWDSNIKKFVVPFSIQSIIEEFTDPATEVIHGKLVKIRPLSSVIDSYDRFIGPQKELYVRHPETYTFYHYFKSRGLKTVKFYAEFPPHSFEKIIALIELGLGSKEPIPFRGMMVKPVDFLTEVLKYLPRPKNYKEKEDLWVKITGRKDKSKNIIKMSCIVSTLKGWEEAGSNIDTGMTISIMGQMIKNGIIKEKGSFAPEAVVPAEPFFKELAKRKMIVYENGKRIN